MSAMKRLGILVLVLLLSACAPSPARAASGRVIVRAAITQYEPDAGSPCSPESGSDELYLFESGQTHTVPLDQGTVVYPSGESKPGQQWCIVPFSVQIASGETAVIAQVGTGSVSVPTDKLYSSDGVTLMTVAGQLVIV